MFEFWVKWANAHFLANPTTSKKITGNKPSNLRDSCFAMKSTWDLATF